MRGFFRTIFLAAAILIVGLALRRAWITFYRAAYPVEYSGPVLSQSEKSGVPAALLFAVIRTESGFDPLAQSSVPARGLMQITQDTFEWAQFRLKEEEDLHFDDLFLGDVNIRYGAEILRLLLDEFDSEENALCAYHAGWGNMKKWLQNPEYAPDGKQITHIPFGDTRRYVEKVMETKAVYERLYDLDELRRTLEE